MTLADLMKIRKLGARPVHPIHITDCSEVHEWCVRADVPVLWVGDLNNSDVDFKPIHGLEVVVVGRDGIRSHEQIRAARPKTLWMVGYYGWKNFVSEVRNGTH